MRSSTRARPGGFPSLVPALSITSIAFLLFAPRASAQNEEQTAAARALFHEGSACADHGDLECAADRWRRSMTLRDSDVVRFNLATAEAELGRLVAASELFRSVEASASADAEMRNIAAAERTALAARLARLRVIVVGALDEDIEVLLDGRAMERVMWNVPIPADPGPHAVRVQRGERTVARASVQLAEGESGEVQLRVPADGGNDTSELSPEAVAQQAESSAPTSTIDVDEAGDVRRRRRILGVSIGLGVAAVASVVLAIVLRPSQDPTPSDLPVIELP